MDSNVRQAIEQGQELLRNPKKANNQTLNALIAILASYLASVNFSDSNVATLKQRLENLKR